MRDDRAPDSERLSRLVAVIRRLSTDSDLRPALRFLLESAIALTGAERGFLLFRQGRSLSCEAAVPDLPNVPGPVPSHLSRSVLARVLEGEPVLSTDLTSDERFRGRLSVRRLGLRSVLAVPFASRAGGSGFLYLDSRVSRAYFRAEDLDLLVAIAAQGALALENAALARASSAFGARQASEAYAEGAARLPAAARIGTVPWSAPDCSSPGAAPAAVIGASPGLRRALALAAQVAPSGLPVLIVGESGTGKEVIARAIHRQSPRSTCRFLAENCAAIPEALIESELFGSLRGAFTGAERDREGLFRAADGGTLFLDEIGEMPPGLQARLLRALQEGEVRPVGSHRSVRVDVRIVAATNRDPGEAIASGRLRLDLYYRLAGVTIEVPPLRDRLEDIPLLATHFLERSARVHGTATLRLSPEALHCLAGHDWPGNVRELENEIERAAILAPGPEIGSADLSPRIGGDDGPLRQPRVGSAPRTPLAPVRTAERCMIEAALVGERGSVTGAAQTIGWSRQKLYRRMLQLGVPRRFGRDPAV